jgi:DNA replication protein DnaC
LQVTLKSEARGSMPEDKLKELMKHEHNLLGAEEEEKLYNNLRVALAEVKNSIVINGWTDNGSKERAQKERAQKEFDFFIVLQPLQTIIHIEAKRSCSKSSKGKAAEQLKKGLDFAIKNFPFPCNEGWKYTRVVYFGSSNQGQSQVEHLFDICPTCNLFVINSKTNLNEWWFNITKQIETSTWKSHSTSTYIMMCKFLLHQMFQQGQSVTQNDIIRYTEETSEAIFTYKNIIFWSTQQFSLLYNDKNQRIFFISPFGTGKTTLIKAQAKELLEAKHKVIFVFFEESDTSQETLLQKTYQVEFPGATIVTLQGSGRIFFFV